MQDGHVVLEVEDDGVGIVLKPANALDRGGAGIGMQNVRERLEVLYGGRARFTVVSRPGRGTLVSISIPATIPEDAPDSAQTRPLAQAAPLPARRDS
jgi:two-component system LytT family sensor kinase